MLFDMAADQLEPSWVVRQTDEYLDAIDSAAGDEEFRALTARWRGIAYYQGRDDQRVSHVISGPFSSYLAVMRRFYPHEMTPPDDDINLPEIESMRGSTSRPLKGRTRKVGTVRQTQVTEFLFRSAHREALDQSGLLKFAHHELQAIRRIRAGIGEQQAARKEFLHKLFSSGRRR